MDGPELYRRATARRLRSATATLERAGVTAADVDLWVPHQANSRIISAAAERIGLPPEQVMVDLAERGNTSAASIPLALANAAATAASARATRPAQRDRRRPGLDQPAAAVGPVTGADDARSAGW